MKENNNIYIYIKLPERQSPSKSINAFECGSDILKILFFFLYHLKKPLDFQ